MAMCCIGEAAATTCNYDENHEGKESEQDSGPLRTDYTTHSLRMEMLIAMTAATLLTTMIDRTVRRLIRPTDEPNAQNDGTERRMNNLSHRQNTKPEYQATTTKRHANLHSVVQPTNQYSGDSIYRAAPITETKTTS